MGTVSCHCGTGAVLRVCAQLSAPKQAPSIAVCSFQPLHTYTQNEVNLSDAAVQNAPLGHPPKWVYVEVSVGVFSVPIIIAAFSVLTMTMAVLVIQLVAGELIGSLYAVGLLTKCPEALLGVGLAIINSMGDLATNLAAARRSERMAFASCFSSQAFNLLLAPAIGAIVSLKESRLDVLPLEFGPIVWVMIVGLLIYFVVLLAAATLGSGNSAIGEPYTLPHGFHAVASMAFKLFVVAVLVVAAPSWIRALL